MYEILSEKLDEYKNDYKLLTSLYDNIIDSYNYGKLTYTEREFLISIYFSYKDKLESKM